MLVLASERLSSGRWGVAVLRFRTFGPALQVRKGMVLVDERLKPSASWEFDADIAILTHSTTIQPRYQAVIHCEIIRQARCVWRGASCVCVLLCFVSHKARGL